MWPYLLSAKHGRKREAIDFKFIVAHCLDHKIIEIMVDEIILFLFLHINVWLQVSCLKYDNS